MARKKQNLNETAAVPQVEKVAQDMEKTTRLVQQALRKSEGLGDKSLGELWDYFKALLRMVDARVRQRYVALPWSSLLMALGAVVYFVNPLDILPDFVLALGFLDDVTILAFVIRRLTTDIENFLRWEQQASLASAASAD